MDNIERYIEKVREFVNNNPDISEDLLVRYVFLDLAEQLSFDTDYLPFGNSKKRQDIYKAVRSPFYIDKCFARKTVICNTAAKILEIVLREFGVYIITTDDINDIRRYPHVYNVIKPKDGREPYVVDVQEDMYRVQMHGRTPSYGLSEEGEYVISYFEQEQMDRRLGYINDENYYTDDYIYLLKNDISYMDSLYEKVKHVLENIEVYDSPFMGYIDRQWFHVRLLEQLFDESVFEYGKGSSSIRVIDTYRMINGVRYPINYIIVTDNNIQYVFVYRRDKQGYEEISMDHLITSVREGLVIHNSKVKEVERQINQK